MQLKKLILITDCKIYIFLKYCHIFKIKFIYLLCHIIYQVFSFQCGAGDNMSMIGDRLKRLRKDYGYTQKQIAEYLDIDQAYISRIEKVKEL